MLRTTDISEVWERIRPLVERIRTRCRESWQPEDVKAAVLAGDAHLLTDDAGFLVWRLQSNRYSGERELLVWVAGGKGVDLARWDAQLGELARLCGAARIVMSSPRRGWRRRMLPGWRVRQVTYERTL